jgi:hypothetical protein
MMKSPIISRHPLDQADVVKIVLGQAASDALRSIGPHCLVMAAPADSTAPEAAQGRFILLCIPTGKAQLDAAYHVARGTHRAAKIKVPASPIRHRVVL